MDDDLRYRLLELIANGEWQSRQYLEETLKCSRAELDEVAAGTKLESGLRLQIYQNGADWLAREREKRKQP